MWWVLQWILAFQHLNTLHRFVRAPHPLSPSNYKELIPTRESENIMIILQDPWIFWVRTWPGCWQWERTTWGLPLSAGDAEKRGLHGLRSDETGSSNIQSSGTAECGSGPYPLSVGWSYMSWNLCPALTVAVPSSDQLCGMWFWTLLLSAKPPSLALLEIL